MSDELPGDGRSSRGPDEASKSDYRTLAVLAVLAVVVCVRLAVPVGTGIFLGTLAAFTARPVHVWLARRSGRSELAAFLCAAACLVLLMGLVGGFLFVFISRGAALGGQLAGALAPGGSLERASRGLDRALGPLGLSSAALDQHVQRAVDGAASYVAGLAGAAMSLALRWTVALFFTVVTVYSVLARWARLEHWAEALLPLRPADTRQLIAQLRSLGREVVLGTVLIGLIQGVLAGVSYAVLGVPQAMFLGAVTSVASTIPAFGTMLVWAPIGVYLIVTGHVAAGIAQLTWGTLVVVTASDGLLRPNLVGRGSKMGLLPALVGIFGGVEIFGFVGLLLGPTLMGIALALLRLYAQGRAAHAREVRRASLHSSEAVTAEDERPSLPDGAPVASARGGFHSTGRQP